MIAEARPRQREREAAGTKRSGRAAGRKTVMTSAAQRLGPAIIGAALLLAALSGAALAGERNNDASRADGQWINEAGFIGGYGTAPIDEGRYKTMLLIAHIGTNVNRFLPALRGHRGTLSLFLEPQFNPVLKPSAVEFGLGIGLQYAYPLTEWISPYILLATGPHYITVDTTTQADGFNFSNAIGVGFYLTLTKGVALNCGYRHRHVSNAELRQPNSGIDSDIGLVGVSYFF
ncbi:MAG: acyloxyacyl hydrolase [Syntrophales bacterium]